MRKQVRALSIFVLAVVVALLPMVALKPGQAFATGGNCYFGGLTGVRSSGWCAVANTDGDYGTNDVLPGRNTSGGCTTGAARGCAIAWGTSKAGFVTLIRNYYNTGGSRAKTGAGLIIQSMLIGVGGSGHPFPTAADESAWESLVMDSTFTYERVSVTNTTWYDPGKNNDFFDSYSSPPRTRDVLTIRQHGRAVGRIEVDCGNMTGYQDSPFKWGPMSATSVAKDAAGNTITGGSIAAGQTIYWTHTVTDDGVSGDPNGTDPTPTITGDIIWGGNTALNGVIETNNTYSRSFSNGDSITRTRSRGTSAADIGNRYCQRINGNSRASWDLGNFSSTGACVLVVPPPKVTPSTCVSATSPPCTSTSNSIGVGQQYTATSKLTNATGMDGTVTATARTWLDSGDPSCSAPGHPCTYNPLSDTIVGLIDGPRTVPVPAGSTVTFNTQGGTADATHAYVCTEIYNVTGQSGTIVTASNSKTCIPIVTRPYFSVLGGDVAAGAGFGVAGVAGANIIGTNNDGSPDYNGASAQLAALALGNVKSFVTSQSQNGGVGPVWTNSLSSAYSPSALGFANSPVPAGAYGGGFTQPSWAVQNYYSDTPNGGVFPGFASAGAGNYYSPSGMTLNGATITSAPGGRKIVLKVNGDVYINGNIVYGATGSISDAPQFELIVSGNIYVDHSVTELDGFYDAQGNGGTTGKFVSCSDSTPQALYDTANIATCNNQLVVNGAVAAQKVILNRTYGDINGGGIPQAPGEIIRFSPLLWAPSATGGSGTSGWQSVTSLPPIL